MQNPYIQEIPEFIKKGYPRKTAFYLTIFFHNFGIGKWILSKNKGKKTMIIKKTPCEEMKETLSTAKDNLEQLRENIIRYFYVNNNELRNYYFNPYCNKSEAYQKELVRPVHTFTQIISGDRKQQLEELKKELDEIGVQLEYSFPLYGQIGFVKAKNKTRN